jgi:aminoglycoside/choline kinase family phosphotransferase
MESVMTSPRNTSKAHKSSLAMIAQYKPIAAKSLAQKIAHFLDWAASNCKGTYFTHNIILKAVNNYSHTPRPNTDEVKLIRSSMQRAKAILRQDFKRGFASVRDLGVRACTDDNDTVKHDLTAANKRIASAHNHAADVVSVINPNKLTGHEASYFRMTVKTLKQISNNEIAALLPPKP